MDSMTVKKMESPSVRQLRATELSEVHGGIGPLILVIGAAGGGVSGYINGGWSGAASGALFGVATTVTGGLAAATTGFVRVGWAARSIGLAAANGGLQKRIPAKQR